MSRLAMPAHALAATLACALAQACAAREPVRPPTCERVVLALASGLTPEIVSRDWGTGETHAEPDAALELRGCKGELLDRLPLPAPLATLDPTPLRGAPSPTWLVSADLTAPAGTYSGPLTLPVEIVAHRLHPAEAVGRGGKREPIRLALTGKAAWKRLPAGRVDDLVAVASEPTDGGFVTHYRRYQPGPRGWALRIRSEGGLWESDGGFPPLTRFP